MAKTIYDAVLKFNDRQNVQNEFLSSEARLTILINKYTMNKGKVFLGLIAGFAAGASLGIMLAPDKGSETRKLFLHKPAEASDPLIEKFLEFLRCVADDKENVNKVGDELIGKVKSTLHHLAKERKSIETESGTYKN